MIALARPAISRGSRRGAGLLLVLLFLAQSPRASVIGVSEPAQPLTAERISQLPTVQRTLWLAYLHRSQEQERLDRAALAAERSHVGTTPPDPPLGHSAQSMPLNREQSWYASPEARHIADVIVSFQTPAGGWGKNMEMSGATRQPGQSFVSNNANRFPDAHDFDAARDPSWHYVGTLDNDATTTELRFLARVQASHPDATGDPYRRSFLRGIRYLLAAQYPNGGWPQVWPLEGGYHDAITFNDDAVLNATQLLNEIADRKSNLSFVPDDIRQQARKATDAALHCILASQVVIAGQRTIWAQQVDMLTLRPVAARNYEPAALSSDESTHLLLYLMQLPDPAADVRSSVIAGISWLQSHAIRDKAVVGGRDTPEGRHLITQQGSGPIWARFYSLDKQQPIFGDRDKTIHDSMNEISSERRNGYGWFNTAPLVALDTFKTWSLHHAT